MEEQLPALVDILMGALPAVKKRYISKKNLEDLVKAKNPPDWFWEQSGHTQRRMITKAMQRMGFQPYSDRTWQIR